jgi:branched-chain amino acid aminotransferase
MSASFPTTDWIWRDGEFVRWEDATLHVMSHVVQYGSSVFEGIRSYDTPDGPAILRLGAHVRRFYDSCKIYRMSPQPKREELATACHEIMERNGLKECYIRPVAYRGFGTAGLNPQGSPVRTCVICWPWGAILGHGGGDAEGVSVCVSSWHRPSPDTHPTLAKAGGNYLTSQLMRMEAQENGYDEAIALSPSGLVSEGTGQNVFLVRGGELLTPPVDGTILAGITRDCVIRIAGDLGIPVREVPVPRELLYVADEVFLVGTASEIAPVRSVDRITVGQGERPVTRRIQERFFDITRGRAPDVHGWLDRAPRRVAAGAPV